MTSGTRAFWLTFKQTRLPQTRLLQTRLQRDFNSLSLIPLASLSGLAPFLIACGGSSGGGGGGGNGDNGDMGGTPPATMSLSLPAESIMVGETQSLTATAVLAVPSVMGADKIEDVSAAVFSGGLTGTHASFMVSVNDAGRVVLSGALPNSKTDYTITIKATLNNDDKPYTYTITVSASDDPVMVKSDISASQTAIDTAVMSATMNGDANVRLNKESDLSGDAALTLLEDVSTLFEDADVNDDAYTYSVMHDGDADNNMLVAATTSGMLTLTGMLTDADANALDDEKILVTVTATDVDAATGAGMRANATAEATVTVTVNEAGWEANAHAPVRNSLAGDDGRFATSDDTSGNPSFFAGIIVYNTGSNRSTVFTFLRDPEGFGLSGDLGLHRPNADFFDGAMLKSGQSDLANSIDLLTYASGSPSAKTSAKTSPSLYEIDGVGIIKKSGEGNAAVSIAKSEANQFNARDDNLLAGFITFTLVVEIDHGLGEDSIEWVAALVRNEPSTTSHATSTPAYGANIDEFTLGLSETASLVNPQPYILVLSPGGADAGVATDSNVVTLHFNGTTANTREAATVRILDFNPAQDSIKFTGPDGSDDDSNPDLLTANQLFGEDSISTGSDEYGRYAQYTVQNGASNNPNNDQFIIRLYDWGDPWNARYSAGTGTETDSTYSNALGTDAVFAFS